MTHAPNAKTERIQLLNDNLRRSFLGGTVMITPGIETLSPSTRAQLLHQIRQFDDFEIGSDPYGEHDFGTVELDGTRFFWKVDYYNRELDGGSEDPADPAKTLEILIGRTSAGTGDLGISDLAPSV